MPLYIVRWPAFNVSIVKARDEQHLMDLLDEESDPGACRWAVYRGPLWINLDLPVEPDWDPATCETANPRELGELKIKGTESLNEPFLLYQVSLGGSDTAWDQREAITKWAFPHLHRVYRKQEGLEDAPPPKKLLRALRKELVGMLQYFWRAAQVEKRTDLEAFLLKKLHLTVAPPWLKRILEREATKAPDEPAE